MKNKKIFSALLALALVLSSFAGCRAENKEETQEALMPSISTAATGRYVEREIPLPECQYAMDMVMLSNGKLRLALKEASGKIIFCTQGQKENTWETDFIPEEILTSGNVESVALSPDGTVFCNTLQKLDDETYQPHMWVVEQDSTCRELPMEYEEVDPEKGFFMGYRDFTNIS